ncbi:hypothetical protein D9611_000335 [Ephemerocybe angulata]|uniref:Uncharacterized protein n=1 Tax=Ephemerocybe angulata TaxID=980116 RepID=A0A8H5BM14_9AGAR|nr:hypothetical protein D9611_000335 [Tulosesus angulatus]
MTVYLYIPVLIVFLIERSPVNFNILCFFPLPTLRTSNISSQPESPKDSGDMEFHIPPAHWGCSGAEEWHELLDMLSVRTYEAMRSFERYDGDDAFEIWHAWLEAELGVAQSVFAFAMLYAEGAIRHPPWLRTAMELLEGEHRVKMDRVAFRRNHARYATKFFSQLPADSTPPGLSWWRWHAEKLNDLPLPQKVISEQALDTWRNHVERRPPTKTGASLRRDLEAVQHGEILVDNHLGWLKKSLESLEACLRRAEVHRDGHEELLVSTLFSSPWL